MAVPVELIQKFVFFLAGLFNIDVDEYIDNLEGLLDEVIHRLAQATEAVVVIRGALAAGPEGDHIITEEEWGRILDEVQDIWEPRAE